MVTFLFLFLFWVFFFLIYFSVFWSSLSSKLKFVTNFNPCVIGYHFGIYLTASIEAK